MTTNAMNLKDEGPDPIATALINLDSVARRHYELEGGLASLLENVETPLGRRQFSRLIGVMVKAPFADERKRPPAESTHAIYAMDWKDEATLREVGQGQWQVEFMRALISEERGIPLSEVDTYSALTQFKYESSLGKFIFEAFRKRICGNARLSKTVKDAVAAAKASGINLMDPTIANISGGLAATVALAVGAALPTSIAVVGAPVIGTIALLLLQVGVEGFCEWSRQVIEEADAQDRAERHD